MQGRRGSKAFYSYIMYFILIYFICIYIKYSPTNCSHTIPFHMLSTPVCSCVLGQSVMLPQSTVVQLQASGVLPASQPVIVVAGGTTPLHKHTVNALPSAAGSGSITGKITVTKPLLQSTTPATGLDVSSVCVR